ncbi:hypothetical protein U9M48_020765 [Paspalum notatum var. saurae]|uniref:DUF4220 domain-containing protein n=1 Tax=Paspalum notatum var. saurae TaxID=547442 RepID=A0AAQ3WSS7_PASNO
MQFLVVLSLALQVLQLSLAGVRRHTDDKGIWISILWVAYQLADYTTTAQHEHQLVAFWAPFLLLHFGGPDNIAAYELEDSNLWVRSILNMVASAALVLVAVYVLYKHISGGGWTSFSVAAIFMLVVGLVKSFEKTWALRNASLSIIRDSVRAETPDKKSSFFLEYEEPRLWGLKQGGDVAQQEELLKRHAHALFHVCKSAMVDSSVGDEADDPSRSSSHQSDGLLRGFSEKGG